MESIRCSCHYSFIRKNSCVTYLLICNKITRTRSCATSNKHPFHNVIYFFKFNLWILSPDSVPVYKIRDKWKSSKSYLNDTIRIVDWIILNTRKPFFFFISFNEKVDFLELGNEWIFPCSYKQSSQTTITDYWIGILDQRFLNLWLRLGNKWSSKHIWTNVHRCISQWFYR